MKLQTGAHPTRFRLPAAYSMEIGRIITRWAFLESLLKRMAYSVLDVGQKEGRLAVREPRAADHMTMIEELLAVKGLAVAPDFKEIKDNLVPLERNRDALAHGIWVKHPATKIPVLQALKGKWSHPAMPKTKRIIVPEGMPITLEALRANTKSIEAGCIVIMRLHRSIEAQLESLPQKSSER